MTLEIAFIYFESLIRISNIFEDMVMNFRFHLQSLDPDLFLTSILFYTFTLALLSEGEVERLYAYRDLSARIREEVSWAMAQASFILAIGALR